MEHSLHYSEPLTAQKLFSKLYVSYYARLVRFASLYVGGWEMLRILCKIFSLFMGTQGGASGTSTA